MAAATGGNIVTGLISGAIGGMFFGIAGSVIEGMKLQGLAAIATHAIAGAASGAASAAATGGNIGMSAAIGGISAGASKWLGGAGPLKDVAGKGFSKYLNNVARRAAIGAIVGGGTSAALGGNFGDGARQGAMTSAIAYTANETLHEAMKQAKKALTLDTNKAKQIASEELAIHQGHNDIDDAMRHAEWSKRMAGEVNSLTSWVAGVGHELDGLIHGEDWNEFRMDIHNNAEGRSAASEGRPINPNNLIVDPKNNKYLPY